MKDYYAILNVPTNASPDAIKKSYRQLAQTLHPDKNQNNPKTAAQFQEIKEAYEILTNPAKKAYYLQQRWYQQSLGKNKMQKTTTPFSVLKQALEAERYMASVDIYRMDKQGLVHYLTELISDDTLQKLESYQDPTTDFQIIQTILKTMEPLPLAYHQPILLQLKKLADKNESALLLIATFSGKQSKKHRREKYSLLIIIILTAFLCLLIFFAAR